MLNHIFDESECVQIPRESEWSIKVILSSKVECHIQVIQSQNPDKSTAIHCK